MNKMYRVVSGWIKWRGVKKYPEDEFIASNPNEQEQKILKAQCEPVKAATARVISDPVKLPETGNKKKNKTVKGDKS